MNLVISTLLIGIGATLVIDLWGNIRQAWLGVAAPDYGLVGRWIGHMPAGQFRQQSIKTASAVTGERWLGWCAHYLIGIAFAAILVWIAGRDWVTQPTLLPAVGVGIGSVIAPYFVMQPGMGLGIAAAKTAKPNSARLHSLITHSLFGLGLYCSAALLTLIELNSFS